MGEKEEFGSSGFTVKTDPVQISETDDQGMRPIRNEYD